MKINYANWGRNYFNTPHIGIIFNKEYIQMSLVILNHHWWIIINKKQK